MAEIDYTFGDLIVATKTSLIYPIREGDVFIAEAVLIPLDGEGDLGVLLTGLRSPPTSLGAFNAHAFRKLIPKDPSFFTGQPLPTGDTP